MAGDLTTAHPHLSPQQVSFTVLLQAACDQIVTGNGITASEPVTLVGAIGRAVLANDPAATPVASEVTDSEEVQQVPLQPKTPPPNGPEIQPPHRSDP